MNSDVFTSGYNISTLKVPDIASDFRYLYFPGKPAIKCLQDIIDLMSAANAPNAGVHWTCIPDGTTAYLCVATVGNHESPVPIDVWPTWWNGEGGTLEETRELNKIEVKKDMIVSNFQKKRSLGNYVLYNGRFRRPSDADKWTENNSGDWGVLSDAHVTDEGGLYKVGSNSIKIYLDVATEEGIGYYPDDYSLDMNLSYLATRNVSPQIGFYIYRHAVDMTGAEPFQILMGTGDPANLDYYYTELFTRVTQADSWMHIALPVGPYTEYGINNVSGWAKSGGGDWEHIDWVGFYYSAFADNAALYVDGLRIEGLLTRAAYDSNKFSTQKCKMVTIRDNVPKDDSLSADDDTGEMGQFAKAELRRAIYTPIVGQICVSLQESMRGGQLGHIHFGKKADGTFRINTDMRIPVVRHHLGRDGAKSFLDLTDDVKNSRAVGVTDAYEMLMKATSPQFQDRIFGSLISGDVDVAMTILEKPYDTSTW
jgi:hypothetical protein